MTRRRLWGTFGLALVASIAAALMTGDEWIGIIAAGWVWLVAITEVAHGH